jgi:N-acetylmuramoyl-L-alanine amidase
MSDSTRWLRRGWLQAGQRIARLVVIACVVGVVGLLIASLLGLGRWSPRSETPGEAGAVQPISTLTAASTPPLTPTPTLASTPAPTPTPAPHVPHIGVVVGHWWLEESGQQSLDVGAVCDEGTSYQLTELEINLEIAGRVVFELRRAGYQADLLQEWDERLSGYRADVLVSIHADACLYPEASGFKVARVADSHVPAIEDRLVACLVEHYGARTGLFFHADSITHDMTQYHTFYEIHPNTPGAIIEVGFMLADRPLLTQRPDLVAQGIIDGILCFLEGEGIIPE